jgi:N-acetylglucosaminyl-diphospho-decaprenol L-rhamnosyltransferase
MNKLLTIVFNSYFSKKSLNKVLKNLIKYKIIIIENSLDKSLKLELEKKYKNVRVVLPKENLGTSRGFNLGIKLATTKYVFISNPDIKITNRSIDELILCAQKIKKFALIAPTYKIEKIHKNYSNYSKKIEVDKPFFKKYKILSVNWIDNNFIINRKLIKNILFDENYFLYFETIDFCKKLKRERKNLLVSKKIKFIHYGSKSVDIKHKEIVIKSRAWHYNWSKFYYYRKNFDYFYAFTKILPNLIQAIKKILINLVRFNKFNISLSFIEIYGIVSSILCLNSFYRPFQKNKSNKIIKEN